MNQKTKEYINREINKTKFKVLFQEMILNSKTNINKIKVYFNNGIFYKLSVVDNTGINKVLKELKGGIN